MAYKLINADCFVWMNEQDENSITAIVTDPPYGVREYTDVELDKQRRGTGGIWRICSETVRWGRLSPFLRKTY